MHRSCVVTFARYDIWVDLIILGMVDFYIILGIDFLAPYQAILDYYLRS